MLRRPDLYARWTLLLLHLNVLNHRAKLLLAKLDLQRRSWCFIFLFLMQSLIPGVARARIVGGSRVSNIAQLLPIPARAVGIHLICARAAENALVLVLRHVSLSLCPLGVAAAIV